MKFSLFAHMERVDEHQRQQDLYDEFISLCQIADEGGMSTIWTGEHHGMDFTIAPNPFLNLIDLSHRTKNVRLGTGTVVAPYWNPIKLAGEAAMTDIVTGGRLELGIARGAYSFEYERMVQGGIDAWEAGERLREMVPAIKGLWKGNHTQDSKHYQFPKTTSAPKPLTEDGPPIWVAARDINSHEFALSNHCNVQVTPLWQGLDEVETLIAKYNEACNKFDRRTKIMILQHAYVANDESELDRAAAKLHEFYCYFGAWFKNERPINHGLIESLTKDEIENHPFYKKEAIRKDLMIGTSKQIIERLKHYEDLGYDEFSYWSDSGMSRSEKEISLRRFIDEVMPAFS
ncbi:LLM class flavin-dependent oxidoreductase [Marinomonas balearica]|uniref:Alkanesulfonate monooxygenase SsuD/methylene tetrahydromethanopterin reductase-like flavin-dependent oxidoreductase (Luciferase family) n=1 Tax=Marinomonas balearica TaxID=491947 RepID=A0A4V6PTS1_9GAMM|nr:LLM class flavin-dependent oxidoreductase [Marinomonas balearica]TDO95332.1 alkanesulfonate monooxygenase SsuD/methylene tetrahydromethanopterin reductase-like flavin-dependent oxidoreductase (luciferase family) [Marinomonas balearica]